MWLWRSWFEIYFFFYSSYVSLHVLWLSWLPFSVTCVRHNFCTLPTVLLLYFPSHPHPIPKFLIRLDFQISFVEFDLS